MSFPRFRRKSAPHIVIRRVSRMTRSSAGNSSSHALKGIAASRLWSGSLDSVFVWFVTRVFNSSVTLDFHSRSIPRLRRIQQAVKRGLGITVGSVPQLTIYASINHACINDLHNDLHALVTNHDVGRNYDGLTPRIASLVSPQAMRTSMASLEGIGALRLKSTYLYNKVKSALVKFS